MKQRKVIVNADDFGLTEAVNAGIIEAAAAGVISSVSVLTVGSDFDKGIGALLKHAHIGIGVHLCLHDEIPLSSPAEIPTLVHKSHFAGYSRFLWKYLLHRIEYREIYIEWKRQIDKAIAAGIVPSHLDTHNHVHLFPQLFSILIHLAEEYSIPSVRILRHGSCEGNQVSIGNCIKWFLSLRSQVEYGQLNARGISFSDRIMGFYNNGSWTAERLSDSLGQAIHGETTEIICHPGYGTSRDYDRYKKWNFLWGQELAAIKSIISGLAHGGSISLTHYGNEGTPVEKQNIFNGLSVVIPAYNEFENIQKTLKKIIRFLDVAVKDYEIIVIDDGSTDGTAAVAQAVAQGKNCRVITRTERDGYGGALKAGFLLAQKEWIFYCDGDYPAAIENLATALLYTDRYAMIIGSRSNSINDGLFRHLYRKIYGAHIRSSFGLTTIDINFAFKLFKKELFHKMSLSAKGSFLDAEMLLQVKKLGYPVKEIPIVGLRRTFGKSHLHNPFNIGRIIKDSLLYRFMMQ
ncbi:MAG: ChbG/HpnK family deacetylase [Elusimicrobia bacterium]|nr:ChbG/HpnK family deacetylase [Elusimicrobiota bacterium]